MLGRLVAIATVAALAGCAGMESAGRNASRDQVASTPTPAPAPRPVASAPTPPPAAAPLPAPVVSAPRPAPTPAPTVTAAPAPPPPQAVITPRTTAAPPIEDDEAPTSVDTSRRAASDIIVPGVRERQVQPPRGDPRSTSERMTDIRAWDQCVTRVQAAFESDPMSPQLDSPEEYCSESLGMTNRDAVPLSRTERRRN